MNFGDSRFPARFWSKVKPPENEDDCWLWTGAIKAQAGRNKRYATYTHEGRPRQMVTVVAEVALPEWDPEMVRPINTCESEWVCARTDHIGFKPKKICKNGHENPKRDKNHNCIQCKRDREKERPTRPSGPRKRRVQPKPVEGFTVFGDKEQTEIWRPPGWSKEPLNGKLSA